MKCANNTGALFVGRSPGWNELGLVSSDRVAFSENISWNVCTHSIVDNVLGEKTDEVFEASVHTFCHSRVVEVAAIEEAVVARWLELLEKCLQQRRDGWGLKLWFSTIEIQDLLECNGSPPFLSVGEPDWSPTHRFNYITGQTTLPHTCCRVRCVHESLSESEGYIPLKLETLRIQ